MEHVMLPLGPPKGYVLPTDQPEMLRDSYWRLNNLYTGVDKNGMRFDFKMRRQQNDFYWRMHFFNVILKSRQHGFTTMCCLLGLDKCLFVPNYHAHFIQQTQQDSFSTFNSKISDPYYQFAKDYPELIKQFNLGVKADNKHELVFNNGSTISTGTSGRGSTVQFLHISEYAKICARQPETAKEIRSGSLNTVHKGNFAIIESTAEGRSGDFYSVCMRAKQLADSGVRLTEFDFRFFFYPWFTDMENAINPDGIAEVKEMHEYFGRLKSEGIYLTPGQRAWYIKKKEQQEDLMFREHPSTPEEAFQGQMERKTYGRVLTRLRREGRIQPFLPYEPRVRVNTSWDLGKNDENAIWLHQYNELTGMHRFLHYYENHGYAMDHYWDYVQGLREKEGFQWGYHFLPHDVMVSESTMNVGETRRDYLEKLGMCDIIVVSRVPQLADGIDATRQMLQGSQFSEEGCRQGLIHLEEYEAFVYDEGNLSARQSRSHHRHSNAADAIRQIAQEWHPGMAYRNRKSPRPKNWRLA